MRGARNEKNDDTDEDHPIRKKAYVYYDKNAIALDYEIPNQNRRHDHRPHSNDRKHRSDSDRHHREPGRELSGRRRRTKHSTSTTTHRHYTGRDRSYSHQPRRHHQQHRHPEHNRNISTNKLLNFSLQDGKAVIDKFRQWNNNRQDRKEEERKENLKAQISKPIPKENGLPERALALLSDAEKVRLGLSRPPHRPIRDISEVEQIVGHSLPERISRPSLPQSLPNLVNPEPGPPLGRSKQAIPDPSTLKRRPTRETVFGDFIDPVDKEGTLQSNNTQHGRYPTEVSRRGDVPSLDRRQTMMEAAKERGKSTLLRISQFNESSSDSDQSFECQGFGTYPNPQLTERIAPGMQVKPTVNDEHQTNLLESQWQPKFQKPSQHDLGRLNLNQPRRSSLAQGQDRGKASPSSEYSSEDSSWSSFMDQLSNTPPVSDPSSLTPPSVATTQQHVTNLGRAQKSPMDLESEKSTTRQRDVSTQNTSTFLDPANNQWVDAPLSQAALDYVFSYQDDAEDHTVRRSPARHAESSTMRTLQDIQANSNLTAGTSEQCLLPVVAREIESEGGESIPIRRLRTPIWEGEWDSTCEEIDDDDNDRIVDEYSPPYPHTPESPAKRDTEFYQFYDSLLASRSNLGRK